MIKRTIEVARLPAHIGVRLDQLQLSREGELAASVPCEDVGILVLDQLQSTITTSALARLAELDAIVIVCGKNHHPVGLYYPLADHTQVVPRIALQSSTARPLKKRLWRQLIRAKLKAQARNLEAGPQRTRLLELARTVRSGDPENAEAQGAKAYWSAWLAWSLFLSQSTG